MTICSTESGEPRSKLIPFPHIYLRDFLIPADFEAITTSADVNIAPAPDAESLLTSLEGASYEPVQFPGCTSSKAEYLRWLERSSIPKGTHATCEAQGMALRLKAPMDETVRALDGFFKSPGFVELIRTKFGIEAPTRAEAGVQKYLHGYEISPHPDIREKAATWMLNVNPATDSESFAFHTHYMAMKPEWSFIASLWEHNASLQTCWVPWDWCTTLKRQPENNSIVLFSPRWDTMHAIRAHYDHLTTQRTQFYGNLWYETVDLAPYRPEYHDYDFLDHAPPRSLHDAASRLRQRAGAAFGR